ncbi:MULTISPECIES: hypothetical protein [Haloferax]|uniref:hypothetical protein n=1 Tax=Haloferax TaxID=2251 RepID=UPI0011C02EA0|nr:MULTISPECIES: hypothetical protein [Haloferax]
MTEKDVGNRGGDSSDTVAVTQSPDTSSPNASSPDDICPPWLGGTSRLEESVFAGAETTNNCGHSGVPGESSNPRDASDRFSDDSVMTDCDRYPKMKPRAKLCRV